MVINKLNIAKEWHIQPSEIDRLAFYEYEMICEQIHITQKEQEKREKKQNEQYSNMQSSMDPSRYMRNMNNNMPGMKMPSLPKLSLPRM